MWFYPSSCLMHCFHLNDTCLFQYGCVPIQHIFNFYYDRKLINILDDLMNVDMCECVSVCYISQWHKLASMDVFSEEYKMLGSLGGSFFCGGGGACV